MYVICMVGSRSRTLTQYSACMTCTCVIPITGEQHILGDVIQLPWNKMSDPVVMSNWSMVVQSILNSVWYEPALHTYTRQCITRSTVVIELYYCDQADRASNS